MNENFIRYFEFEHIKKHEETLEKLLDLNFGKDWRIFLLLYYSGPLCRHHCRYAPFNDVEDAQLSWVKRRAYFARAKMIMKKYFSLGYEATEKEINEDKYRLIWNKAFVISSELFDLAVQKKLEQSLEGKNIIVEEQAPKISKSEELDIINTKYYEVNQEINELEKKISALEQKDTLSEWEMQELEDLQASLRKKYRKSEALEQRIR